MSTDVITVQHHTVRRLSVQIRSKAVALLWAAGLGLVSGLACVGARLFFRLLQWLIVRHSGLLPYAAAALTPAHRVVVPLLGAGLAMVVIAMSRRFSSDEESEGYVEAVRFEHGRIPFKPTLWRTISSGCSVATGAAIGREGSMIQFATAATSWAGSRRSTDGFSLGRKLACGVSAAVAAAYQAPIAGVFFVFEIVTGTWDWAQVPELAVSSVTGWLVSRTLLGTGPLFAIHGVLPFGKDVAWTLPLALLLSVIGPGYQWLLHSFRFFRRLPLPLLWGGLAVGLLSLLNPSVWGNGDVALTDTLTGFPVLQVTGAVLLMRPCRDGCLHRRWNGRRRFHTNAVHWRRAGSCVRTSAAPATACAARCRWPERISGCCHARTLDGCVHGRRAHRAVAPLAVIRWPEPRSQRTCASHFTPCTV